MPRSRQDPQDDRHTTRARALNVRAGTDGVPSGTSPTFDDSPARLRPLRGVEGDVAGEVRAAPTASGRLRETLLDLGLTSGMPREPSRRRSAWAWRYLGDTGGAAYGSHGACKPNCPGSSTSREDGPTACGPRAVGREGPFRDRARSTRHTRLRRGGGRRARAVARAWGRRRSRRRSSSSTGPGASFGPGATTCPSCPGHRARRRREPGISGLDGTRGPRSLRRVGGCDRPDKTRYACC